MGFESQIREALAELEASGLLRRPLRISGPQGPEVEIDGRRVLCLCSNNYLGLANHPDIASAANASAPVDGVGAAASRLITGTMDAHREAEEAFADFLGAPSAALFSTGYAANLGTIQALVGPGDLVFSDALNHASLIDGCRLSRAEIHVYAHRSPGDLESLLERHRAKGRRALVVTDSLFSMDGVTAPLGEIARLASAFDAGLLVDEAHALGVLGPNGRGVAAAAGVKPDVVIGTLGKSFGVAGAFVAASEATVSLIRNRARSFVYSTAPPPMLARAAIAALELVRDAKDARETLLAHAGALRAGLRELGFDVPDGESQILPVLIGENERTMRLSAELLDLGVFVQGIRPPTVAPGTARLRLTPMATHKPEQIAMAIEAFASLRSRG
ncbi:MAG: 8-amino-7-oxononanoate synthase [Deltaproteobacteria bacterium]|nr:8-amino-7-oxononanoate synthase [Deltaproteobacteria bacterium]NND27077.1 8-amino-7-oxononanoate synthase [Myxococcales bacterium]MBT8466668.1 8-amino-7-oxononanoate synthase [Deltaproteobacteria bacterium]MBT8481149.1 8-amino-7-oxononanoate synthase [Deltaproteobacteria bacterium]NNK09205.1 8-amino-7-oxononanoate synthase [Myxococcales bacterium]